MIHTIVLVVCASQRPVKYTGFKKRCALRRQHSLLIVTSIGCMLYK